MVKIEKLSQSNYCICVVNTTTGKLKVRPV